MQMPQPNADVIARKPQIVAALRAVLPRDAVIDDPRETKAYECDALAAYRCMPLAVVLPRNTAEVAAALKVCAAMGVPVVPRGAGTSLAGGSMPSEDAVVLGLARMNSVLEVDYADRVIKVEAGRTNLSVTGAIEGDGWFYAPDPSSQLACAISGNIAMNSGGAHCLKYGVTTNNLLGVTMVTMAGDVVDIGGPVKENDCGCCSDISGTEVDCRVWEAGGQIYDVPPQELLAEEILRRVFGHEDQYAQCVL